VRIWRSSARLLLPLLPILAPAGLRAQQPDSIWYQDRGAEPRPLPPGETRIDTALKLAALLHNGRVTGFYDGQFASVRDRFDDLASIAGDPDMGHVLRLVAVMALQEAGDGEPVRKALEPLLIPAEQEFTIEYGVRRDPQSLDDESQQRDYLVAELSQHARFALAKDGQPGAVLAKIRVMEQSVHRKLAELLDPSVDSDSNQARVNSVAEDREVIFDIGYHYQQFDDFEHAAQWFNRLCDSLPGHRDTQMAHYNVGCIDALTGHPEDAMEHLRAAHAVGFTNVEWLQEDGDLASLRGRPDFAALVALMRNQTPPDAPQAPPKVEPQPGAGR
jgi:hypothetical protein